MFLRLLVPEYCRWIIYNIINKRDMETKTGMTVGSKVVERYKNNVSPSKLESSNIFDRHGIDDMHIIGLAD